MGGQATTMKVKVCKMKQMSVVFLVRPTLLSRVLVNDFQAIFFILLVLFSFSFLAKKKKKMNKLKARFIAEEKLKALAIDKFFVTSFLIAKFFHCSISYLKFFDSSLLLQRITFKIINYRFLKLL